MCRPGLNGISMLSLTDVEFELLKAAYRGCEADGCTHELLPGVLVSELLSGDGAGASVWVAAERETTPGRRGPGVVAGGRLFGG